MLRVRVDPITSDAKLVRELLSIDQPNVRKRGNGELGDALRHSRDLLVVERPEATVSRGEQLDLARYHAGEM